MANIKDIYYGGSQEEWESIERYGDFSGISMHFARKAGTYKKIPVPVDDSVVDYGYCGKNVYWMLDKDGCLTIGGSGRMNDYSYRFDLFLSEDIKRVVIQEGVTHIREVNGLAKDPNGPDWYYLAEGQAQTQYTGLAMYDGEWFYVVDGKLAVDYYRTVEYDGASFEVVAGMVQ